MIFLKVCINFSPVLRGGEAEGTSFWARVEFQADNAQLVRSTGANVSVMLLQGPK